MGNTGLLRREAEMTLLQPHLGETRRQELRNASFWPPSLFKSQLVKEGEDFLLKKGTSKTLRVLDPIRISPFVVPTRKEAPTGNVPMGAIPLKTVTSHFPLAEENQTSEAPGVVFDPTTGEEGVETPLPNDSSKASLSPPVGGRLRSFRRLANKQMFIKRVEHYHQWLRTAIPLKAKLGQISSDSVRIQDPSKRPSSGRLHPVSPVKECYRKVGKCKISRVLQSPVSSPQASPKVETSNRLKQAQHFSTCRKLQNGDSRVHQDLPGSRGMGIVDRPIGRLPSHLHPSKLKEIPKVLPQVFQFTSLPFGLATAPQVFTMIVKEVKLMALSRGLRLHQYVDDWLIRSQSQEEAQVNTQAVVDLTQSLGWIINQEKSELTPTQVFSFVGYEYHLDSALVKPTQERWLKLQNLILRLKSKHVLTARCLMSLIGLLASMEKMVPEGRLHMRPFQFHLKEHWRYPQSLDNLLPWTDVISAHLDWWHNPTNVMKGADLHPKDHSIQLFTDASNEGWGAHLDQKIYLGSVVRPGKKATHKRPRVEGGLTGPSKFQGPVPGPNSSSCNGQLDSGSLHKQTRGNSLSRDVRSPVEDYDLVPPLSHNIKGQTHSRVSEYDGRPPIQVQPSAVDRMVTASTGVQTDLPEVVHSSCGPVCHSCEPQTPSLRVPNPRPKGLGHRCSEHKLDGSHCLCLPSDGSPSQRDPKDQAMPLPDHCNSPRLARDALVLGPSAALNRDPTTTPSVNDPTQTVPQVCVPQQPATAQPPRLVSRSGQLQEQGFSVEVAERIAAPQRSSTRTIYKSKWALFEKWCRENLVDFFTPSVKQILDFCMYLY